MKFTEAIIEEHEILKRVNENTPLHRRVNSFLNLGITFRRKGEIDSAAYYVAKSLELDRNFAEGYFWMGDLFLQLGDTTHALENLERACVLRPEMASWLGDGGYYVGILNDRRLLDLAEKYKEED